MKKKLGIFISIILSICLFITTPLNVCASKLSGFNKVLLSSADSDPTNGKCKKLEGMAVSKKYIYNAKRSNDKKYVSIYRTKISTGETVLLQFPKESNPNYTEHLGCAKDMQVIDINGQTTLMVATRTSIVQVKVDNSNKQLTIQKEYKLKNVSYISSIARDNKNSGVFYLRTKAKKDASGFIIYKVTISLSKSSLNTPITLKGNNIKKICKLKKIRKHANGQGMAYYKGKLYLGMSKTLTDSSGNSYQQSYIGIYKIPSTYDSVEVQDYKKLKHKGEIEGVDITGGYLYFSKKIGNTSPYSYVVYKSKKQ